MTDGPLGDDSYRELLTLQDELRRFLHWRDARAAAAGLSPGQHQLLLAIRGHADPRGPTVGDVAGHLSLRHHSAVELVQRAEAAGLVVRHADAADRRRVRLALGDGGRRALEELEPLHAEELRRLCSGFGSLADGLAPGTPSRLGRPAPDRRDPHEPHTGERPGTTPRTGTEVAGPVLVARLSDAPGPDAGTRVLVDRTWPHGVRAEEAPFDEWLRTVAPSGELRRWHAGDPTRFEEFRRRYLAELRSTASLAVERLAELFAAGPVVLLTEEDDPERSAARVLADLLSSGET